METIAGVETQLDQQIPVIMYEGGVALNPISASTPWYNAFLASQTDAGQTAITTTYLTDLANAGVTGVNYYEFIYAASTFGEWGSMDFLGEPSSETPKYNALVAFAESSSLVLTGFPDDDVAGSKEDITVIAFGPDGSGIDTGYTGTVEFSSSDPNASLPAAYTFTAADAGVHTFTISLYTAGIQSITVSDPAHQLSLTQSNINVNPAAATSLRVGVTSPVIAGVPNSITVTAYDAYGNVATGYTGTVAFTTSDPIGAMPANYTFNWYNGGVESLTATLNLVGTQTITVTDTATASITGSVSTTVEPGTIAAYLNRDTTTQGNWENVYGTQGLRPCQRCDQPPLLRQRHSRRSNQHLDHHLVRHSRTQTPGSSNRVVAVVGFEHQLHDRRQFQRRSSRTTSPCTRSTGTIGAQRADPDRKRRHRRDPG